MSEDFYIGYQAKAPTLLARHLRSVVLGMLVVGGGLGALLAALQAPFDNGFFEYLQYRDFEGRIEGRPYPALLVERPGSVVAEGSRVSRYHLVEFGKHGAGEDVLNLDGRSAHLSGSLIYRDDQTMIEIQKGTLEVLGDAVRDESSERMAVDLGVHTLTGEIVDSKCYLGVMKPGRGKTHRACAARCISGGVPPVLLVESKGGERAYFLLVDEQGRPVNERVLSLVAEPVEITGKVLRQGGALVLYADPSGYRRRS